jgi:predicted small metal-binding protein
MFKNIVVLALALVLAITFSIVVLAQDAQKDVKKDEKTEMTKSDKEAGPIMSVSCGPECGFMVKSRNEKELISIVKTHAKSMHHKKVSDKDVKGMIKTEEK